LQSHEFVTEALELLNNFTFTALGDGMGDQVLAALNSLFRWEHLTEGVRTVLSETLVSVLDRTAAECSEHAGLHGNKDSLFESLQVFRGQVELPLLPEHALQVSERYGTAYDGCIRIIVCAYNSQYHSLCLQLTVLLACLTTILMQLFNRLWEFRLKLGGTADGTSSSSSESNPVAWYLAAALFDLLMRPHRFRSTELQRVSSEALRQAH
jgi:hypothetical protein